VLKATEKLEGQEARDKLSRRYHGLQKRMGQLKQDELLEWYLTAMTTSYDPHSTYMSPSTKENFEIQMRLNLQGIGAQLQYDDGYTVVHKVIPGGAADKDGRLKKRDRVVGVGQGESGPVRDVGDQSLNEVVDQIRGKKGTIVRLEVIPYGTSEKQIYNIAASPNRAEEAEARASHHQNATARRAYRLCLAAELLHGREEPASDSPTTKHDAYVRRFANFRKESTPWWTYANGGGSLTEATDLTAFIDEGSRAGEGQRRSTSAVQRRRQGARTARGALQQVLAPSSGFRGAIQDYNRIIVGDPQTHGKGTVQSLLDLGGDQVPGVRNRRYHHAAVLPLTAIVRRTKNCAQT
jgi:carboxyl-terminal processing protease